MAAIDLRGSWFGPYPYWNASTGADGARLRGDLEVLPDLAEAGLCAAAKDVSMGGLVGTAAMLAECSGVGVTIDVSAVPAPAGAALAKWLTCFPSYGFLLAVPPAHTSAVAARFAARDRRRRRRHLRRLAARRPDRRHGGTRDLLGPLRGAVHRLRPRTSRARHNQLWRWQGGRRSGPDRSTVVIGVL